MGKPQSKVEIQENILTNGEVSNKDNLISLDTIIILGIVILFLYMAYKINVYFKNYVTKHTNRNNNPLADV